MLNKYTLMHKNIPCGIIIIDSATGKVNNYKDLDNRYSPFLGNANFDKISKWWEMRAIPGNRTLIQNLIKNAQYVNAESYLEKNLGLSITDTYWINPIDSELTFEDVNLRNLIHSDNTKIPYHNATSYDPNASLGGQMEKYWDLSGINAVLVKESYKHFGQQAINEAFATKLHQQLDCNIPFVKYSIQKTEDNGVSCKCKEFTSSKIESVNAYEVVESRKLSNQKSVYESYINICSDIGIPHEDMQRFMDYQTITDFLLSNEDRHLLNQAILRDNESMKIVGIAPIYDSGNSMFYKEGNRKHTRVSILDKTITAMYSTEEKMLAQVKNKNIIDIEKIPSKDYVLNFYTKVGLPEEKADSIAHNYSIKKDMICDLQRGIKISLYNEKQQVKKVNINHTQVTNNKDLYFEMVCGLPNSGKTKIAKDILQKYEDKGYKVIDSKGFYPLNKFLAKNEMILDRSDTLRSAKAIGNYTKHITYVSANDIRNEMSKSCGYVDDDMVFLLADARIKSAIASNVSIVFDAMNLDKSIREYYCDIVGPEAQKILNIASDKSLSNKKRDIPKEKIEYLKERFVGKPPTKEEGWLEIKGHVPTRSKNIPTH